MLDHLGLVASVIKDIGLISKIDEREKGAKLTIGQCVAAVILNGLGFMDNRLYMQSDEKAVSQSANASDVTYGYSKVHRPDLMQVVLNLATTGVANFPLEIAPCMNAL